MENVNSEFERSNKILELNKIYEPIKEEIIKEWEDWRNSDVSHKRDDNKINKLLNELKKECPYLYNTKRKEAYRIMKSFIDKDQNHQIHCIYIKLEFDFEGFCRSFEDEDEPIVGIRTKETSEEIAKNCVMIDKEYFDDCLRKAMDFLKSKYIV